MRRTLQHALPDQPTRLRSILEDAIRGLFTDGGPAAGGGGAPAAPAAAAAPAAPAAAAPAPDPKAAPAPDPKAAPAAAPAAKKDDAVIAPAAEPAKPTVEDMRKFLVDKGGKADELAKLADADLQKQYDDAKAKEKPAPKAGEVKPEDIKVTIPEGIAVDEKTLADFKGLIADAKLTPQERAQKLIDLHVGALKAAADGSQKVWVELQTKWQGDVKADKELGGQNYDAMRSTIAKAVTEVGGEQAAEIFEAFKLTGAGNHPAIVRLVFRMSKLVVEPDHVAGGAPADGKGKDFASRVQAMYPSANNGTAKAA